MPRYSDGMSKRNIRQANSLPCPTESQEQQVIFQWAALQKCVYPELDLMFHPANEGKRTPWTGAKMRSEGLKKGVPDIFLPSAKGGSHGLFIELKSKRDGAKPTPEQIGWMDALKRQGYEVALCKGSDAAIQTIMRYLREEDAEGTRSCPRLPSGFITSGTNRG